MTNTAENTRELNDVSELTAEALEAVSAGSFWDVVTTVASVAAGALTTTCVKNASDPDHRI
jgi:hypothetical protein